MTFAEILPFLDRGFAVRRAEYDKTLIIFKQIPTSIDDVSVLKSVPTQVKDLLLKVNVGIDYEDQYIIYDFFTGVATHCVFDGEDINAKDWEIVDSNYNPYS
jgi:hypothetical protein